MEEGDRLNNEINRTRLFLDMENCSKYKNNLLDSLRNGIFYGGVLFFLFGKPKIVFPIVLGACFGYCHRDLSRTFIFAKENIKLPPFAEEAPEVEVNQYRDEKQLRKG